MQKNTSEKGKFKEKIHSVLYKSNEIKELLLDNIETDKMDNSEIRVNFKKHVKSHLFIDDTIQETSSFIFYDIILPFIKPNIKTCKILLYAICHRDILDNYYKDGYFGNRADILTQMIENVLINDKKIVNEFGIGELSLDSVDIYNSNRFYGYIMTFSVPNFR